MTRTSRPRLLLSNAAPKSALKRPCSTYFDSMWLESPAPSSNSSNILSVLRDLMSANLGQDGNLSRSLQEEAGKLRPLLALLD